MLSFPRDSPFPFVLSFPASEYFNSSWLLVSVAAAVEQFTDVAMHDSTSNMDLRTETFHSACARVFDPHHPCGCNTARTNAAAEEANRAVPHTAGRVLAWADHGSWAIAESFCVLFHSRWSNMLKKIMLKNRGGQITLKIPKKSNTEDFPKKTPKINFALSFHDECFFTFNKKL